MALRRIEDALSDQYELHQLEKMMVISPFGDGGWTMHGYPFTKEEKKAIVNNVLLSDEVDLGCDIDTVDAYIEVSENLGYGIPFAVDVTIRPIGSSLVSWKLALED